MKIGRDRNTQGILADVDDVAYVPYDELLETALKKMKEAPPPPDDVIQDIAKEEWKKDQQDIQKELMELKSRIDVDKDKFSSLESEIDKLKEEKKELEEKVEASLQGDGEIINLLKKVSK